MNIGDVLKCRYNFKGRGQVCRVTKMENDRHTTFVTVEFYQTGILERYTRNYLEENFSEILQSPPEQNRTRRRSIYAPYQSASQMDAR